MITRSLDIKLRAPGLAAPSRLQGERICRYATRPCLYRCSFAIFINMIEFSVDVEGIEPPITRSQIWRIATMQHAPNSKNSNNRSLPITGS